MSTHDVKNTGPGKRGMIFAEMIRSFRSKFGTS